MAATARQEHDLKCKYAKKYLDPDLDALARLQAFVFSKGVRTLKNISNIFKRHDKDKSGKLTFKEFQNGLHAAGLVVDVSLEEECFNQMDQDRSGKLSFDEFLIALRPPMSRHRKELIQQAFNKLDRLNTGVATWEDMKGVYCATKHPKYISGEWSEEDVFKNWLNSFNGPDNFSGEVHHDEFENYYVGVSASIDDDPYFDLMMRQAWKL